MRGFGNMGGMGNMGAMMKQVQKAMEQAFGGFQKGLDAVIQTALKQFADAQTKSRRGANPLCSTRRFHYVHGPSCKAAGLC